MADGEVSQQAVRKTTSATEEENDDDDDEDTFGDLIGCRPILRQHPHHHLQRLSFPHRNSLHISPVTSASGSQIGGRHFLGLPDKYDKKLRRLSDPGGGIMGSLRLDESGRMHSPSGKLCDPRLEVIRSLSPSKASQAAGEEGEALAPPLLAARSSRSKSVFQLPAGLNFNKGGDVRMRSMSISGHSSSEGGKATTPTKTRPDSPTPPACFFDQQPPLLRPKPLYLKPIPPYDGGQLVQECPPLIRVNLDLAQSRDRQDENLHRERSTSSAFYCRDQPPPSPPPSSSSSSPPPMMDYLTASAMFRRRRSISLEGTKLESILEENSKSSRKMSLPDFDNSA